MKISRLDQQIKLLKPQLISDGYGGFITSYVNVRTVWAEIKKSRFSEKAAFDTSNAESSITMRIRPYSGIKKGWHISWKDKEYEVTSVTGFYSDSNYIEIVEYEKGV